MWLSAEKHPTTYVAASTDIGGEDTITDEMLMAVPVPGDFDTLRQSLIPYENRAILYGLTPPRKYVPGDMFFQRDIEAPHRTRPIRSARAVPPDQRRRAVHQGATTTRTKPRSIPAATRSRSPSARISTSARGGCCRSSIPTRIRTATRRNGSSPSRSCRKKSGEDSSARRQERGLPNGPAGRHRQRAARAAGGRRHPLRDPRRDSL